MTYMEEVLYELDYIINWQEHDPYGDPEELVRNMQECAGRIKKILVKEIVPDALKKPTRETIRGRRSPRRLLRRKLGFRRSIYLTEKADESRYSD